jgi:hypothetical protein
MYTRQCPKCGNELSYKSKYNRNFAEKTNIICRSCSAKKRDNESNWKKYNEEIQAGIRKNPWEGRSHSEISKKKISKAHIGKVLSTKTKEKISKSTTGEKNGMYGRSFFDVWVEKYGEEEALLKREKWRQKISNATKGENNPMYGKPIPQKSGNGTSGWYKKFYFRSLHELKFILVCERFELKIESAEHYKFHYENYDGNKRTYSPDFLVKEKYIVEVKPKKLMKTPLNKLKFNAANKFCDENNLKFKVVDFGIIEQYELDNLIKKNLVKLNESKNNK